jgi:hypothetical protein
VVVDEAVGVGAFGPAAGGLVQLVGEHADGEPVAAGLAENPRPGRACSLASTLRQSAVQERARSCMVASGTPWASSWTVSRSGHLVAPIRSCSTGPR